MTKPIEVFLQYMPPQAAQYSYDLWLKLGFRFKITQSRQSKLGDYRYDPVKKTDAITVNATLNPYSFTLTYIHEVAHMVARQQFGLQILPHGEEWKNTFRELMQPLLHEGVFPSEVLMRLKKYFINPKASSASDPYLTKALALYNEKSNDHECLLLDLPEGRTFELRGRMFVKSAKRRTRSLCTDLHTGKSYLISNVAQIKLPTA